MSDKDKTIGELTREGELDGIAGVYPVRPDNEYYMSGYNFGLKKMREDGEIHYCTECGVTFGDSDELMSHKCDETTTRYKLVRAYKACFANSLGYVHASDSVLEKSLDSFYGRLESFLKRMDEGGSSDSNSPKFNKGSFKRRDEMLHQMRLIEEAFS